MRIILFKLLKDLRFAWGKVLLMILAAVLSSWGIGTVIYSYMMTERDFEVNFGRTFPADIEFTVKDYRPEVEKILLADTSVTDLERREVIGGRIKDLNGNWMPLLLFVTEDVSDIRLDRFRILEQDNEAGGKILIENNALFFIDDNQDSIEVQIPGKGEVKWKIGGKAHDARLAPARMERTVFAYVTSPDIVKPFSNENRRRFLIETNVSADLGKLQEVAERLRQKTKNAGSSVLYFNIPTPGKHIHQNIVDGISFLQKNGGGIISIMGIILLSLILLTWIFPQVSQIGVMKAIGASTKNIFFAYLATLIFIISIGLLIGLPLGYKTAFLYNKLISGIQNFEVVKESLSFGIHLIVILLSLIIPTLFGLSPILKASKITVNEAMNKTFYTPLKRMFQLSQTLIPNVEMKYAVHSLFRNTQRSILVIFLTAIGVSLFFTGANLEYSMKEEMRDFASNANYDFSMRLPSLMEKKDVFFLEGLPYIEAYSFAKERRVTYRPPNASFNKVKVMRVLSKNHDIKERFVLKGSIDKNCKNCIYISGEGMKEDFENVALGEMIQIQLDKSGETKSYKYSGIFKNMAAIGAAFFVIDDQETKYFNAIDFEVKKGFSETEAANNIDDLLLNNGVDISGMLSVKRRLSSLQAHFEPTYLILKATGVFTVFLGFLGLFIVVNLTLQERTREIGIMKSLGCSFGKVSGILQKEFFLVLLLAILLGTLVAMPLTAGLCEVISQTVIFHLIPPKSNYTIKVMATFALIIFQFLMITANNYFKIKKNARELLEHNF